MPKAVASTDLLAALGTLPDASSQSFHLDSLNAGNSGVTAFEVDQYVDVLFGAFQGLLIVHELRGDRSKATELIRSRLADQTPPCVFTDSEWEAIVEPCAWQFLVHHVFMARKVQDFEAVRVCIKRTKTAVMDSRTAHAGTEWTGEPDCKRLLRGHFYGFERNVLKRKLDDPTQKDEFTTIDLCDDDHFPIVTWAQRGKAGPIFAPRP
jgi:hypothetical protein